mmetsp:Transcript_33207/g.98858  ORF Transcript_33207/g.98858 Transcript_33207/m.98858 type:complete len:205 (+) Transcript_33207:779-1393(+)
MASTASPVAGAGSPSTKGAAQYLGSLGGSIFTRIFSFGRVASLWSSSYLTTKLPPPASLSTTASYQPPSSSQMAKTVELAVIGGRGLILSRVTEDLVESSSHFSSKELLPVSLTTTAVYHPAPSPSNFASTKSPAESGAGASPASIALPLTSAAGAAAGAAAGVAGVSAAGVSRAWTEAAAPSLASLRSSFRPSVSHSPDSSSK